METASENHRDFSVVLDQGKRSAEKFIAMIDNYQDFDTMAATMLNEFVEKILVHDHERDFRRSFSISHWAGKKNWSIEISNSVAILKRMFKLGCWPRFSIYMMERGVRSRSWAKYSCVQPLPFRFRLIS